MVTYECDPGYVLNGFPINICRGEGEWVLWGASLPACVPGKKNYLQRYLTPQTKNSAIESVVPSRFLLLSTDFKRIFLLWRTSPKDMGS